VSTRYILLCPLVRTRRATMGRKDVR
jgi:hypothetical protein